MDDHLHEHILRVLKAAQHDIAVKKAKEREMLKILYGLQARNHGLLTYARSAEHRAKSLENELHHAEDRIAAEKTAKEDAEKARQDYKVLCERATAAWRASQVILKEREDELDAAADRRLAERTRLPTRAINPSLPSAVRLLVIRQPSSLDENDRVAEAKAAVAAVSRKVNFLRAKLAQFKRTEERIQKAAASSELPSMMKQTTQYRHYYHQHTSKGA